MPKSRFKKPFFENIPVPAGWVVTSLVLAVLLLFIAALPAIGLLMEYQPPQVGMKPFSVTVDPKNKVITENPEVEATLSGNSLTSTVTFAGSAVELAAFKVAATPVGNLLAFAGGPMFVAIEPGFRKEEVANAFGRALSWSADEKKGFLLLRAEGDPVLHEGNFPPGVYVIPQGGNPVDAGRLIEERFRRQILARYATSTQEIIPLDDALTLASIIERETADKEEMRIISGILWNRIFAGMRLQVDATLQYVKANSKKTELKDWWPTVVPKDKYIKSPYNTYQNAGLPPAPISNPSISAVIAALAPKKTDCLFYFHDNNGWFHCSKTYEEHVTLLKKYFGRGR